MCRYLITSDFVVIKLHLNSTRIESSQFILNGSWSKLCSQQATRKGSPWAKPGTAGFYLLPSFWSKAHIVAGGAGEAGQADPGAGEREGDARVAPAGERRSNQGDQKLSIILQKKKAVQIKVIWNFLLCLRKKPKVLENENLALAALLGNLKEQLSQVLQSKNKNKTGLRKSFLSKTIRTLKYKYHR